MGWRLFRRIFLKCVGTAIPYTTHHQHRHHHRHRRHHDKHVYRLITFHQAVVAVVDGGVKTMKLKRRENNRIEEEEEEGQNRNGKLGITNINTYGTEYSHMDLRVTFIYSVSVRAF